MGFFGQGRSTVECRRAAGCACFNKMKENELKKGSKLIIRPGQKANLLLLTAGWRAVFETRRLRFYSEIVHFFVQL